MPEASIDEDHHATPRENEIGPDRAMFCDADGVVDPVSQAHPVDDTADREFRTGVAPAIGPHDGAPNRVHTRHGLRVAHEPADTLHAQCALAVVESPACVGTLHIG